MIKEENPLTLWTQHPIGIRGKMKFTNQEFHQLLIGISSWKQKLDWKHPVYTELEKLENKLLDNKTELIE